MVSGTEDDLGGLVEAALSRFPVGPACGSDLREDPGPNSLYYRLRDARSEARIIERRAESEPEPAEYGVEQWRAVVELAGEALATRSKDVEIASWLLEALTRRSGFAGFIAGTRILIGLVRSFWSDGLHPRPEEDDPAATLASVGGLSGDDRDGTLVQPLRNTPILVLPSGIAVTSWSYNYARDLSTLPAARLEAMRVPDRLPRFPDIELFLQGGEGRRQLTATGRQVLAGLEVWKDLDDVVVATGMPSIPTSRVQAALQGIREIAGRYVKEEPNRPPAPADQAPGNDATAAAPPRTVSAAGLVTPREELLDYVLRVARVFREREPNSPFSYTLEEAVRRARLPLGGLLEELVPDEQARTAIMSSLGIRVGVDYSLETAGDLGQDLPEAIRSRTVPKLVREPIREPIREPVQDRRPQPVTPGVEPGPEPEPEPYAGADDDDLGF